MSDDLSQRRNARTMQGVVCAMTSDGYDLDDVLADGGPAHQRRREGGAMSGQPGRLFLPWWKYRLLPGWWRPWTWERRPQWSSTAHRRIGVPVPPEPTDVQLREAELRQALDKPRRTLVRTDQIGWRADSLESADLSATFANPPPRPVAPPPVIDELARRRRDREEKKYSRFDKHREIGR